jgi:hypothetical protein
MAALYPAAAVSGCAVSPQSAMVLNIAAGQVAVPTGSPYETVLCTSTAVENVTLDPAPASGTNRIDLVVATARSADWGGANEDFIFQKVNGTQAATPVAPAVPAQSVALAQVYVAGGSASVTAGNITDRRPGVLAVPSGVWVPVTTFSTGWANLGSSYRACAWRVDANKRVSVRGVAGYTGTIGAQGASPIFTLPSGARPLSIELFVVEAMTVTGQGGWGRADMQLNGQIQFVNPQNAATPANPWVSLCGISFDGDGS